MVELTRVFLVSPIQHRHALRNLFFSTRALLIFLLISMPPGDGYEKKTLDDNLPKEEFVTQAGANMTLMCPGVNEHSWVQDLEWRIYSTQTKLVQYIGQSTTVLEHQDRISLLANNYALHFQPVRALDTNEYICLFNTSPQPQAIVRLIVQDVPDPPGRPMIVSFTSRSVNLSWAPSQNVHHSPITHYIIHTRVGEDGEWKEGVLTRDNSTQYKLTDLNPYTVYSFQVLGVNSMGASAPSKESYYFITLREAPSGKPTITNAHNTSSTSLHISWRPPPPETIHGEFLGYRISYRPRDQQSDATKEIYIRDTGVESHVIQNLETYTQYLVELQVFNPEGLGPASIVLAMTDEGIPSRPQNVTVVDIKKDAVSLEWHRPEKPNGIILGYRIFFITPGNYTDARSFRIQNEVPVIQYLLTDLMSDTEYKIEVLAFTMQNEGENSVPIVTRTDIAEPGPPQIINITCQAHESLFVAWRRPVGYVHKILHYIVSFRSEHNQNFDHVEEPDCARPECYSRIPNLTVNTMYEVKIRGVSQSKINAELLEGAYSKPEKIHMRENCDKILPYSRNATDVFMSSPWLGTICLGIVCALFLGIIGCVVWRKCLRLKKCNHDASYYYLAEPVCEPILEAAQWESTPRCNINCSDTESGENPEPPKPGAIPVSEFAEHVARLHVDSDIGFSKEYDAIQAESNDVKFEAEISQQPDNRPKNRYLNIIAYDHTRVALLPASGQKKSLDYVNANYIDGFQFKKAYIGTQGPLPSTFDCFWRMVWEQRVVIIVMITNLVERGRRKCDMYWPKDGIETYGYIQVKVIKEDVMATYTIRTLQLRHMKVKRKKNSMAEKIVYQYHYTNWPDHGTPDHPLPVIHFVKKSSNSNPEGSPIIVHCSAGVGRTGTYIVLDSMLREIAAKAEVNVWGFLRHIRTQRNYLVQTEEQYIFIHDALVEAIAPGCETNIPRADFPHYVQSLQAPDEFGHPWKRLRDQFKLITSFQCQDFNLVSANKPVNQPKNRNPNIVPMENSRVHLTPKPGEDGSDYINATWLQGFQSLREFIITQHPLPDTILHFWQMVWDHSVQTVVLVSSISEEFPAFWPTELNEIVSEVYKMKIVNETVLPTHTIRDLSMRSLQDDYELHVRFIQCSGWPHCCPTIATVFDLPTVVQSKCHNGPVVVVDRFGGTEAATFCCLTSLGKHLAFDGHVDIYMLAKLYHNKRPGIWSSYEDYLRLHLAIQTLSPANMVLPDLYASANGCAINVSNGNIRMHNVAVENNSDNNIPSPNVVVPPEVITEIPVEAA